MWGEESKYNSVVKIDKLSSITLKQHVLDHQTVLVNYENVRLN